MARFFKPLSHRTEALAGLAQPVLVAMNTAGLTGGFMVAAGMLADRMVRRG